MPAYELLLFPWLVVAHAGYTHVGTHAAVDVYRQMSSPLIDLLAEGDFDAPPADVAAILLDYAHAGALTPHVVESRVLQRGEHDLVVYQRLHLPVVADRDYTLRVSHVTRGGIARLRFHVDDAGGPSARPGIVRVALLNGGWDLVPIRDGRATHAQYHVQIDLAGSIPRWMVSDGAARDLPVLFEGVRRQLRRRVSMAW